MNRAYEIPKRFWLWFLFLVSGVCIVLCLRVFLYLVSAVSARPPVYFVAPWSVVRPWSQMEPLCSCILPRLRTEYNPNTGNSVLYAVPQPHANPIVREIPPYSWGIRNTVQYTCEPGQLRSAERYEIPYIGV